MDPGPAFQWDYVIDKDYKIGYVRLTGFTETSAAELREAVAQLKREGARMLRQVAKPRQ